LAESSPVPLELIFGDVMNFNLEQMFNEDNKMEWEDKCPQIHLIGNLPFNVSTPLIIRWLKAISERYYILCSIYNFTNFYIFIGKVHGGMVEYV